MIKNANKINLQTAATSCTWKKYIIQTYGPPMGHENTTNQTTETPQPRAQEVAHKLAKKFRKRKLGVEQSPYPPY
jgi:hypothetical protein